MGTRKLGRSTAVSAFGAAAILMAGCEGPTEPRPELLELPRPLTSVETNVISGSNAFAFDLFGVLTADEPGANLFISPLSVSMALGMTMNGAAARTYDEMRATLGFDGLSQEQINDAYRSLIDLLLGLDGDVEMSIANSVWYREEFPFEASFLDAVARSFDAEVKPADFNDPQTLSLINGWVTQATMGRIDSIIERIDVNDVMYLINAIYFKGSWRQQFDPGATREEPFTRQDGSTVDVPMMQTNGTFGYTATPHYQVIDLPYGNGAFLMTIMLPREGEDIDAFIGSLDSTRWAEIRGSVHPGEIMVSMPRFRLELEKSLVEPLKALGMTAPFEDADFTRMSASRGRDLFISDVRHKTYVDVDEEGTEAAAVTGVTIGVTSAPPAVRVDRPFVFAILEKFSGTILFSGKIVDPSDGGG